MKAVIPVAGVGTRLRPHTYTQPKPLMPVAGKPIISFIVDAMVTAGIRDFVFVIGYLGDKIRSFIDEKYPDLNTEFVFQEQRKGSAHAIYAAKDVIKDEDQIIIAFGDTIFDTDMGAFLDSEYSCLGVKKVADPREFGVAEYNDDFLITRLVEKPRIPKSNMAMVGLYKIKEVSQLLDACAYNIENDIKTVGEFQLTDAIQRLISAGTSMKVVPIENWYDCGRKTVLLETNAMLLKLGNFEADVLNMPEFENTIILHPVAIGENCTIANSIIGPHVTIGNNVNINHSIVKESIIGNYGTLDGVLLKESVIGADASVRGLNLSLNIGDNTEIEFD